MCLHFEIRYKYLIQILIVLGSFEFFYISYFHFVFKNVGIKASCQRTR